MTAITNVVVALMIVSGGEEAVRAVPVKELVCETTIPYLVNERVVADGKPETLYRKTCTTNWVYATDVPVRCIWDTCHEEGCGATCRVKPEGIIGSRLQSIFFELKEPLACDKHRTEGRK